MLQNYTIYKEINLNGQETYFVKRWEVDLDGAHVQKFVLVTNKYSEVMQFKTDNYLRFFFRNKKDAKNIVGTLI